MRRAAVRPTAEAEHSAGRKRVAVRLETLTADAGTAMTQGESHDNLDFPGCRHVCETGFLSASRQSRNQSLGYERNNEPKPTEGWWPCSGSDKQAHSRS